MKAFRIIFCLSLMICITAIAQEQGQRPPMDGGGFAGGAPKGIPPELKEKLTADQITKLEAATTMDAKKALLESWNIAMPERRGGPGGRQDKASSSNATTVTASVADLKAKYAAAATDADKDAVKEEMKALFHQASTSDEDKEKIRAFFKATRPAVSYVAPQREYSSSSSGSGAQ